MSLKASVPLHSLVHRRGSLILKKKERKKAADSQKHKSASVLTKAIIQRQSQRARRHQAIPAVQEGEKRIKLL